MPQPVTAPATVAGHIVGESSLRIWGLTSVERLKRQLRRAGVANEVAGAGRVVVLRADWIYDEPLVKGLAGQQPCGLWANGQCVAVVVTPAQLQEATALLATGQAPGNLPALAPEEVAGAYNAHLKKREPPFLLPLVAENLPAIEARVFSGSYKGVTDFVTLYIWPRPARAITRLCAAAGITPNMVTSVSLALTLVAMWAFWHGHYWPGLACAWGMTFLDTVDGKLARVTLNSSKFGDLFDHAIDLFTPPFWWWAWIVGLATVNLALPEGSLALTVIITGYILQRIEEGGFELWFKVPPHLWRRFDSKFRLVTARRNPNLAILTVSMLFGRPDIGIQVVAWWVAICLVVHTVQFGQALLARRRGPITSWLT